MAAMAGLRRRIKTLLLPLATSVLRPIRIRFGLLVSRIEHLERQMAEVRDRGSVSNQSGTIDNLVRTWLRLQNEVSRMAASIPEIADSAVQTRITTLEPRLLAIERGLHQFTEADSVVTIEAKFAAFEARLAKIGSVASSLPEIEEKLASRIQAAEARVAEEHRSRGSRVDDTLRFLLDRVEFVRRELMFELRYGSHDAGGSSRDALEPRILSQDKLEAARIAGNVRLNLGCGHIPEPEYLNVDMRELPGVDVVAEVGKLPFDPASIDEIYSAHLVEHFPQEDMARRLLPHWHRVLKPGGRIRMITPDGEAMLAGLAQGTYGFQDFRDVLFGGQDYEGDFHYNLFTPDTLGRMVSEQGFTDVEVPVRGRRNGQCFEFELTACVPPGGGVR